ncbi:hypothetical protein JTB14_014069 [Gonioctena quinquepunctata]|nr:hypothetical protein JTB14_014069 [Gonioctena quinquepunctata]
MPRNEENSPRQSSSKCDSDREIFWEVKMRIERERNILISKIDQITDANSVVKCIINNIAPATTSRIEAISRVGKPNTQKPRPIKVDFFNENDALQARKEEEAKKREIHPGRAPPSATEITPIQKTAK